MPASGAEGHRLEGGAEGAVRLRRHVDGVGGGAAGAQALHRRGDQDLVHGGRQELGLDREGNAEPPP